MSKHVYASGWEYFTPDLGTVDKCACLVCGADCEVKRNLKGPRGWAQAVGRSKEYWETQPPTHDSFWCPHAAEGWHRQVLAIKQEAEKTRSGWLREHLLQEAKYIIRDRQPTLEEYRDEQDEKQEQEGVAQAEGAGGQ